MANRYWVGNGGDWNDTAHWSTSSGGAGGASVPTSADNVYFDINSFTIAGQTVTLDTYAYCLNMDWTGAINTPTLTGIYSLVIYGSLTLIGDMVYALAKTVWFKGAKTTNTITTAGKTLYGVEFRDGGIWTLQDDLTTTSDVGLLVCTLDTNGKTVSVGGNLLLYGIEYATTKLILGNSTITITGNFSMDYERSKTELVIEAGTSTVIVNGSFYSLGKTFYNVELKGNSAITGANIFNDLKLTAGKTVTFEAGKTQTMTTFSGDGTDGNLITIQSSVAGSPFTISIASGAVIKDYYSIKDCTATGGATFTATNSLDVSGNSGWKFIHYATLTATVTAQATASYIAYSNYKILATGLTAEKGSFFKFNGKLYYLQAGKYTVYDGTTVSEVVPYIPTVIINRTPSGGGDVLENYNRIGKGFINKFNGNATDVAYTLTDANLDDTTVTCTVGGVEKIENTDFTVDRITGIVTFVSAPATGTNNVIITAYKTVQADIDSILKCKHAIPFGGQNDNRLFIGGNGTGYFYWTGISANGIDATYFAYNNYNVIGNSDEDITGFGKHYDVLTIHKESGEIFGETYTFDGTKGVFNTFPINQQYGCDCPYTMQNINNSLVWLNSRYGVCILLGTAVGSQRNALPISRNINPKLLAEGNLKLASSVDYMGKYWLNINDKVYLWDYTLTPYYETGNPEENARRLSWWYFNNINSGNFIIDGQDLYYASRALGQIVKFRKGFNDFGEAIKSVYRIPYRDLGDSVYEFDVLSMWVDVRADTRTKIDIAYIMADETDLETESAIVETGSFSIPGFSIPTFTLDVNRSRQTFTFEPQEKKIDLFGVEFSNNELDRDMNISNVVFSYKLGKRKR